VVNVYHYLQLMCIGPCIIVIVEEYETNLMSQFIKLYFTSSILNKFRTLIYTSSGACDFFVISSHWLCVLVSMCVGVSVWLGWSGIRVAVLNHTETPTHIETRTHNQCGDTIEKSQTPDDGFINVRNLLSIEA